MLCLSNELAYVHEPFNPGIWPRWLASPISFRNLYICEENGADYESEMGKIVARKFPFRQQIRDIRSGSGAARLIREGTRQRLGRSPSKATLMKDPIAIFSAEWLAAHFDMKVVMMIRSPLAFASSIKRLSWSFDFNNWLDQPLLMRDHLADYATDIKQASKHPPDLITQSTLTWNATYSYVNKMREHHPDWHFVDYQHLATSPIEGFESLYRMLGLKFDPTVSKAIASYSDSSNVKEVAVGDKGGIRRDSKAAIDTWRERLTPEETKRVEEETRLVAAAIYGSGNAYT